MYSESEASHNNSDSKISGNVLLIKHLGIFFETDPIISANGYTYNNIYSKNNLIN